MDHDPDATGVGEAVVQVAEDAKAYVAAQLAMYRVIAATRGRIVRNGLVFGAVAAVLALAAIGALLVGLILALSPLVGPLGATAIVVGATLLIAGLLGWLAGRRFAKAFEALE